MIATPTPNAPVVNASVLLMAPKAKLFAADTATIAPGRCADDRTVDYPAISPETFNALARFARKSDYAILDIISY